MPGGCRACACTGGVLERLVQLATQEQSTTLQTACRLTGRRSYAALPQLDSTCKPDPWSEFNDRGTEQQVQRRLRDAFAEPAERSGSYRQVQASRGSTSLREKQTRPTGDGEKQTLQRRVKSLGTAPVRFGSANQTTKMPYKAPHDASHLRAQNQSSKSSPPPTNSREQPSSAGARHRWMPQSGSAERPIADAASVSQQESLPSHRRPQQAAPIPAHVIGRRTKAIPRRAVHQRYQQENHMRWCEHNYPPSSCLVCRDMNAEQQTASQQSGHDQQQQHRPQQQQHRASLLASQQARPHASEQKQAAPTSAQQKPPVAEIDVQDNVTVSQLAVLLHVPLQEVEATLTELGETPASPEEVLSPANAELVAMVYGKTARFSKAVLEGEKDAAPRPPVVTIMGHVDHGKTTLLDALRSTSVAAGEAGGITQAIGAFQVRMPDSGGVITFLDTPGHAAFSAMRARGAAVTDLVVLVVAADDGVMPQTREALAHAQASGCPIVVALTKCDMPGANPQAARQQLLAEGLELEEAGGSVQVIETAAPVGLGLQQLEEALLFQAELMDLKASQSRPAVGVVIEAKMDKGQGAVATVIVKQGTLKVGQFVVLGCQWGKVRAMREASSQALKEALPGQPVEVSGLRGMPMAGDDVIVQPSEESARRLSQARQLRKEKLWVESTEHTSSTSGSSASEAEGEAGSSDERQLVVLVRADTQGSAEAVAASVEALSGETVVVKAVQAGLGPVSTSDIDTAVSMGARIVAFNVKGSVAAVDSQAKRRSVPVLRHNVIYHVLQEVSGWMAALAPHVEQEVIRGEADILQTFPVKDKRGQDSTLIAGCRVNSGSIAAPELFRVLRSGDVVWEGRCSSLKRHKLDVQQVGKGTECGVVLEGYSGFQPGDVLRCITTEMRPQAVEDVVTSAHSGKSVAFAG